MMWNRLFLATGLNVLLAISSCAPSQDHNSRSSNVNPAPSPSASADKPWQDPNVACKYLVSAGLLTKRYQDYGGQSWCMASLFYAEDSPVPNEISYTATGDVAHVQQLELSAETYNFLPAEDRKTLETASEMAESLLRLAVGEAFPRAPVEAFRKRASGSWTHGRIKIDVVRDDHSPGRGFTITLRIR